jgi:hypothetical protein
MRGVGSYVASLAKAWLFAWLFATSDFAAESACQAVLLLALISTAEQHMVHRCVWPASKSLPPSGYRNKNNGPLITTVCSCKKEEEGLQGVFKRLRRNGHQLEKGLQMAQRGPSLK